MFIFAKIKCSAGEGGGGKHGNAAMPRTHYLLRLNSITGMKKKRAEWKVKLRRSNFKMHRGELAPRVILAQTYKLNGVLERIVKGGCALSYGTLKHAADLLMNEIEDCLLEGSAVNLPIGILTPGVKGLWQVSERYDPKVRAQNEAVINYKMSAEDYVAHVTATYKALSDSIAADTFPPMFKEILQLGLKEEAVNAMMQGDYFREHNYRSSHNDWDFKTPVKGIDKLKPEQQAAVAQLFDINDPMLLMGWQASDYIGAVAYADNAWLKATGISEGFIPSLRKFVSLARKAQAAELADADLQTFTPEESFYAEALKSMAFIKTDQPFLTGKDHTFLSPFPGQFCKIFHQFSCDSLMSVCREYIQAKHCLIGPLGIVKTYIMIHLIRQTRFICCTSINKSYRFPFCLCHHKIFRKCLL